jgi:hypothetical protein
VNDSTAHGDSDGLSSISRAELLHGVLEMNFHRFFRYEEQVRDIAIPISCRDVS